MMTNVILSSRNIDDLISDIANEVVRKMGEWNITPEQTRKGTVERPLSLPEAADFLHLSKQTLYKRTMLKEIPCMKRQGEKRIYFLKEDLIEYLKEGRKKTRYEIEADADRNIANKKRARS